MKLNRSATLFRRSEGQVLPLVALMLVVLFGVAALAIDVSGAYAARRSYREAADASSLAGAQDLQTTTRAITSANRRDARAHAYRILEDRLGAGAPTADATCIGNTAQSFDFDFPDCALSGTQFRFSILTPSHNCVSCDRTHSVQVTLRNPKFELSFSHVFGMNAWNVGSTSVAGLTFSSAYALITLQPPSPRNNGTDANLLKDLIVKGNNTVLNVLEGDVGSNTSAATTLAGLIVLADGYFVDHYDDLSLIGDTWTKPDGVHPEGRPIATLIPDPDHPYASFANAPAAYTTQAAGETPCTGPDYPTDYTTVLTGVVKCYLPGIYSDSQGFRVRSGVGSPDSAYLMPGSYYFTTGMTVRGTLAGGLVTGSRGVDLVFPQTVALDANNAVYFLLNVGSGPTLCTLSCTALPALDFGSPPQEMKTAEGLILSIEVERDAGCYSGTTPIDSVGCNVNGNTTVGLAGSGQLSIAGVIYGPSDNMSINGGSAQQSTVGQIVSWSVTYTGGSTLNQVYPGLNEVGILRLDAACTVPATPCAP
jgi:hypothetical protein